MNSHQRRKRWREVTTEGGVRRKQNADRRFAIREEIAEQRREEAKRARASKQMYPWKHIWGDAKWSIGSGWTLSNKSIPNTYKIPSLPMLPPGKMYIFTCRYDDDNGIDQGWRNFECTDVVLREVFPDGTKPENLLGTGSLEDRRIGWYVPKKEDTDDGH